MKREIGSLCCEECGDEWTQPLCPACAAQSSESNADGGDENDVCTLYAAHCPKHGFVHGREAHELRTELEALIRLSAVSDILDRVDARDSLAYEESKEFIKTTPGLAERRIKRLESALRAAAQALRESSEEDVVTYGNTQCDQFLHSLEQSAIDAERVLGE